MEDNSRRPVRGGFAWWPPSRVDVLLVALLAAGSLYLANGWISAFRSDDADGTVRTIVDSEELILELTPRLKQLAKGVLNLRFPDHNSYPLLEKHVDVIDILPGAGPVGLQELPTVDVSTSSWPLESSSRTRASDEWQMWRSLLDTVDYFEHAKFYFIRGQFSGADPQAFQAELGFTGLALLQDGTWRAVRARQDVLWRSAETVSGSKWRIAAWHLVRMETFDSPRLMFDEVLETALPDQQQQERARKSHHTDHVIRMIKEGRLPGVDERYQRYFMPTTNGKHPALSVTDVDGDGWDDLYVMTRWGRNQLLHNQGDGSFIESAADKGLDIRGVSTSSIFADFDNDGDKDLILGRFLERSMYLTNEEGKFVDRSEQLVSRPLPYLVTSISAADYNSDGLLDIYLSTYGPPVGIGGTVQGWFDEFLPKAEARELLRRVDDPAVGHHGFVNRVGPRNLLLVNRGGRFEVAPENEQVAVGYNTFQSTWADFDEDGDPDLYISNDFAPDFLFRNEGSDGFRDVTEEVGGGAMRGFGMGASWGDYNNDGRQDLYISNMYSKAGLRITDQVSKLDLRFRQSADGNRLYRHCGDHFELVSGSQPPALLVTQAGWSWGGQFMDVDNDGFLDIYVTSGYYTVPDEVASEVDL